MRTNAIYLYSLALSNNIWGDWIVTLDIEILDPGR